MKEMIKKQKILFLSLFFLVVISIALMTTFAYQTLSVNKKAGSTDEVTIKAGVLDVTFTSSRRIDIKNLPLTNDYYENNYIEFIVDNTNSTEDVQYKILLNNLEYSEALISNDFKYTIVRVDDELEYVIGDNSFEDLFSNEYEFKTNYGEFIYIKKGEKVKIRIYLWLKESENNQNNLENTFFKGIIELNSYFAKDISDKTITEFKAYGNAEIKYDNDTNEQDINHPIEINSLGTLVNDINDENYGKYIIKLSAYPKNLFNTDELFIKENDSWIYQEVFLNSGTYKINYNSSEFDNIMVKDTNNNIIVDKINMTNTFTINKNGLYKVYVGKDGYIFEGLKTPASYLAVLYNTLYFDNDNYEPYIDPLTYNIYLDSPLSCINNECDYIDFMDNKIVRKTGFIKLDSSLNWNNTNNIYTSLVNINTNYAISTHFKYSDNLEFNTFNIRDNKININYSDNTNYNDFLDNNSVYVYYLNESPKIEPINSFNLSSFVNKRIQVSDEDSTYSVDIKYDKK